ARGAQPPRGGGAACGCAAAFRAPWTPPAPPSWRFLPEPPSPLGRPARWERDESSPHCERHPTRRRNGFLMCGICGIWNRAAPAPGHGRIDRMLETIVHRGPDGEGRLDRPGLALGMRRLAIIDLAGGDQPIFNEDGSVAVVFNG